jgi:hypothetical protein
VTVSKIAHLFDKSNHLAGVPCRNPNKGLLKSLKVMITAKTKKPIGTKARTGESCPESGVWKVVGYPTTTAPIAEGNRMPPYDGKAVTWELIQYA